MLIKDLKKSKSEKSNCKNGVIKWDQTLFQNITLIYKDLLNELMKKQTNQKDKRNKKKVINLYH